MCARFDPAAIDPELRVLAVDPDRAERVRVRCRTQLGRHQHRAMRLDVFTGFTWGVLAPAAVGAFCLLYIVALVATTPRLEGAVEDSRRTPGGRAAEPRQLRRKRERKCARRSDPPPIVGESYRPGTNVMPVRLPWPVRTARLSDPSRRAL